jgi:mannose-6-phosphate isomerase-like protein (cupin superfamily)
MLVGKVIVVLLDSALCLSCSASATFATLEWTRAMSSKHSEQPCEQHGGATPVTVVDFEQLPPVECPCGWARRAFVDVPDFPATVHVTEISHDARLHYHRRLTEVYYVLECEPDAQLQLDQRRVDLRPGICVMIPPGVRHRAIGKMKVLIVVAPKFDADDEWFDSDGQQPLEP